MTFNQIYDLIQNDLSPLVKSSNKSLEEYWRSLYPLCFAYKKQVPTLDLFYQLLEEAINAPIVTLKPAWLDLVIAPDEENFFEKDDQQDPITLQQKEFDFFIYSLCFQIAELHKMKGKQLENEYRWGGIDSETGNRWYNFELIELLECGLRCFIDGGAEDDTLESWKDLAMLLEMGRIYE